MILNGKFVKCLVLTPNITSLVLFGAVYLDHSKVIQKKNYNTHRVVCSVAVETSNVRLFPCFAML